MKEKLFPLMSLLLIVGMTGCSGIKNSMRLSEKSSAWNPLHRMSKTKKAAENATPVTMAAIWADSVYEQPGQMDVKGFGGRIFFYDKYNKAVKVDGELIVYGFDDSVKNRKEQIADRKFVFKQEDFHKHYSENDLGASYSVWVPWERVGGFRKTITLIPMFKTADGSLIKCSQSISTLPGKVRKDDRVSQSDKNKPYKVLGPSPAVVSQANYQPGMPIQSADQTVANTGYQVETPPDARIKTSTIRMTPSMSRRMSQAAMNQNRQKAEVMKMQAAMGQKSFPVANPNQVSRTEIVADSNTTEKVSAENGSRQAKRSMIPKSRAFGQPGSWN